MLHLNIDGRKGNFSGEGISPERMGKFGKGSSAVISELLNMLSHVTPGRWWKGEFFPGDGVRPRRTSGGSLTVSSELLNMLLHVRPGRWWRGNFPGREFVLAGFPVKMGDVCTSIPIN